MKKSKVIPLMVSGLLAFNLLGGCGETSNEKENNSSSTEQPKGGKSDKGTYHKPAENCQGGCVDAFFDARTHIGGGVAGNEYRLNNEHIEHTEYAFDDGAWASWYDRGGDYHKSNRFSVGGVGGTVSFSANIDGELKAPCFSAKDIDAGNTAGRRQAAECRKELDKYLGR
jgi:hypothetical protein